MSGSRPHLMQLTPNEDASSVRDRLSFVRGQRVLLVWPEQGTVLQRKLDLVLIQREAMRRAIRMALVTHDPQVIQHAAELNISTFDTIGESERKRWKRGRSKVFTNRYQKPEDEPEPEALQDVASRVKNRRPVNAVRQAVIRLTVALLLVAAVLGVAYVILPGASVTITPDSSQVELTVPITASSDVNDIDVENNVIPMTRLRLEVVQSGTVETTGQQALSDTRAVGSVVFINRTQASIDISEGTAVSTSAGTPIQFRTLEPAALPAGVGLQVEVPVEALQDFAGEIGNVREGQINTVVGPLEGRVDVRNVTPTAGGASQTVSAVSERDVERLESSVRQQIQAQAYTEMLPLLSDTQFIILETVNIAEERSDWKTFSADVGEIADTLTLDMRAVVEAAAVDEQFGRQIAFSSLSSTVPRGRVIETDTIVYSRGAVSQIGQNNTITFDMTVSARVSEPINTADLRSQLAGRPVSEALAYVVNDIELEEGTVPEIRMTPSWFRHMPLLPLRIHIEINEEPTA